MAGELETQCNLIFEFLKSDLPEDMINMDLKLCTLKGIQKDYKSHTSMCSPWGAEVQPYPTLRKKMMEFMCRRQETTTP